MPMQEASGYCNHCDRHHHGGTTFVSPFLIRVVGLVGICWWTALLNAGTLALLLLPLGNRWRAR